MLTSTSFVTALFGTKKTPPPAASASLFEKVQSSINAFEPATATPPPFLVVLLSVTFKLIRVRSPSILSALIPPPFSVEFPYRIPRLMIPTSIGSVNSAGLLILITRSVD